MQFTSEAIRQQGRHVDHNPITIVFAMFFYTSTMRPQRGTRATCVAKQPAEAKDTKRGQTLRCQQRARYIFEAATFLAAACSKASEPAECPFHLAWHQQIRQSNNWWCQTTTTLVATTSLGNSFPLQA